MTRSEVLRRLTATAEGRRTLRRRPRSAPDGRAAAERDEDHSRSIASVVTLRVGMAVVQLLVVLIGVTFATFVLIRLVPGNPALNILGQNATPKSIAALQSQLHLNVSLLPQLWLYLRGIVHGTLGTSLFQQIPVLTIIGRALPVTASVVGLCLLMSLAVGVPIGMWAGVSGSRVANNLFRGVSIVFLATPPFLMGIFLIALVAVRLGAAPAGGWNGTWPGNFRFVWLPALALSASYLMPLIARTVWQSARETWREPFIEATICRGLKRRRLIWRHVLPNSMLPVITVIGVSLGALIGGAVVVEVVFNVPGIGTQLVNAVQERDYPVVQGVALVTAVIAVLVNMTADVLYLVVDPRTRRAD